MSFHYNSDNSYVFVNGKEIYKFKASNKNVNFPSYFCLGRMSNKFVYVDSEEVSLRALIQKKYLQKEICMIFQLIMMLLINLAF